MIQKLVVNGGAALLAMCYHKLNPQLRATCCPCPVPLRAEALLFSLVAGTSISSLNLSLLTNSVGFYQVSRD